MQVGQRCLLRDIGQRDRVLQVRQGTVVGNLLMRDIGHQRNSTSQDTMCHGSRLGLTAAELTYPDRLLQPQVEGLQQCGRGPDDHLASPGGEHACTAPVAPED